MSRDFAPDFGGFREPSPGPRESSHRSGNTRPATTRTREEIPRPEPRFQDVRESRPKEVPPRDSRAVLYDRYRGYDLRESEIQTLTDLGKFRVINSDDLARYGYGGDRGRMERETKRLVQQRLVRRNRSNSHLAGAPECTR
jgi:hypothetical protein